MGRKTGIWGAFVGLTAAEHPRISAPRNEEVPERCKTVAVESPRAGSRDLPRNFDRRLCDRLRAAYASSNSIVTPSNAIGAPSTTCECLSLCACAHERCARVAFLGEPAISARAHVFRSVANETINRPVGGGGYQFFEWVTESFKSPGGFFRYDHPRFSLESRMPQILPARSGTRAGNMRTIIAPTPNAP